MSSPANVLTENQPNINLPQPEKEVKMEIEIPNIQNKKEEQNEQKEEKKEKEEKEEKKEQKEQKDQKGQKEENKVEINLSKSNSQENNIEILEEINEDNVIEENNSIEEIISSESKSDIEFVKEESSKKKAPRKKLLRKRREEEDKDIDIDIEDDDNFGSVEKEKKLNPPRRRGRKTLEEEYNNYMEIQKKKIEDEIIENRPDESDIISIEEEEEKLLNANHESKGDNLNTPYNKLMNISKEYGIGTIIDRLIGFVTQNDSKYNSVDISKDITKDVKDIVKSINVETLNLYLIKLLACSQKKNFKILNDFKMANDENFVRYINIKREGKDPLEELKNELISDESESDSDSDTSEKEKIHSEKKKKREKKKEKEKEKEKMKEKEKEIEDDDEEVISADINGDVDINELEIFDNEQYRYKHFHKKDGIIYCYIPKRNNVKSIVFNLYCSKFGCKGRIRIDMENQSAYEIGEHRPHGSINLKSYLRDYPELEARCWENLQYDIKNGKPILVWRY